MFLLLPHTYTMEEKKKKEPSLSEIFSFTKNGEIKSLTLLSALVLGFVILFLYFLSQNLLTIAFEAWLPGLSRTALNIIDIGVPTLLCTALFCILSFRIKNKKLLPLSFLSALSVIAVVLVYMLLAYPPDARAVFLPVVIWIFLIPVSFGFLALMLCRRLHRKKTEK